MSVDDDGLRQVMRCWTTGVAVVTASDGAMRHGMTVNSLTSISIHPPLVVVTLAKITRTYRLVSRSGIFGVTILKEDQAELADRFAGRIAEEGDRMAGLETFNLVSGAPLLRVGLAFLDCRVVHTYDLPEATLFVGAVEAAERCAEGRPLLYLNREYRKLA
jgi:flavin reductase (DIM6/NTAB) family NADH-FMN oxidoreductase RutF